MSEVGRPPHDLEAEVQRVTRMLKSQTATGASDDLIEETVRDCFAERGDARIKDFVALLVERSARERLRRLPAEGQPSSSTA